MQSGYLTTLAQELANEQAQPHIRAAAGIALKNSFSSREFARLREVQEKWLSQVDAGVKKTVKELALRTLSSPDARAGQSAGQFIASIAAIEIPRDQWPELMPALVQHVGEGADQLKQASLTTIGFICDTDDADLRDALTQHSNAILTAVVQGARKEEANVEVRLAAISALGDSLEFVRTNFDNEGERNYIMQVICEATQCADARVQQGAFGCLNRIMGLYYDKMRFYMEKALFGLTITGMKSDEEDVAKLAVEFWCTVCEEEVAIEDDNAQAQAEGATGLRPFFNFARVATLEVVPVLLLLLTRQDEDAADDDYNVSRAAYQCLQLYAQAVGSAIVPPVLGFVEQNLRHDDWHNRDAAVSAFGAVMEGPDDKMLDPLVKQALPVLIGMMDDKVVQVKDSAAYALGRITESVPEAIDADTHLAPLITALFAGLTSNPKMAASCCWALMNLADRFAGEPGCDENPLSKHFQDSVTHLLQVTERWVSPSAVFPPCLLRSFAFGHALTRFPQNRFGQPAAHRGLRGAQLVRGQRRQRQPARRGQAVGRHPATAREHGAHAGADRRRRGPHHARRDADEPDERAAGHRAAAGARDQAASRPHNARAAAPAVVGGRQVDRGRHHLWRRGRPGQLARGGFCSVHGVLLAAAVRRAGQPGRAGLVLHGHWAGERHYALAGRAVAAVLRHVYESSAEQPAGMDFLRASAAADTMTEHDAEQPVQAGHPAVLWRHCQRHRRPL